MMTAKIFYVALLCGPSGRLELRYDVLVFFFFFFTIFPVKEILVIQQILVLKCYLDASIAVKCSLLKATFWLFRATFEQLFENIQITFRNFKADFLTAQLLSIIESNLPCVIVHATITDFFAKWITVAVSPVALIPARRTISFVWTA